MKWIIPSILFTITTQAATLTSFNDFAVDTNTSALKPDLKKPLEAPKVSLSEEDMIAIAIKDGRAHVSSHYMPTKEYRPTKQYTPNPIPNTTTEFSDYKVLHSIGRQQTP